MLLIIQAGPNLYDLAPCDVCQSIGPRVPFIVSNFYAELCNVFLTRCNCATTTCKTEHRDSTRIQLLYMGPIYIVRKYHEFVFKDVQDVYVEL